MLEGFEEYPLKSDRLTMLSPLGFYLCSYLKTKAPLSLKWVKVGIEQMQKLAEEHDLPIDGIVFTFNDVAYSKSCGQTNHHYKDGMAFKFEDDTYESQLQSIEWNTSRSGEIAPVAVFDTRGDRRVRGVPGQPAQPLLHRKTGADARQPH